MSTKLLIVFKGVLYFAPKITYGKVPFFFIHFSKHIVNYHHAKNFKNLLRRIFLIFEYVKFPYHFTYRLKPDRVIKLITHDSISQNPSW